MTALLAMGAPGCRQDMHDQPKYMPYRPAAFFADQRSARPRIEGTIPRGYLHDDELLETGKVNGQLSAVFPFAIDNRVMRRGRERYDIFCSPCHGLTGDGNGMVVQRGYRRPPSLHTPQLRNHPPGFVFDVITMGFGAMPDYAGQIPAADRWAIVAYLKALQLSQNATAADVSAEGRRVMQ
jgi:mono/diheme cytochrome c family protein